LPSYPFSHQTTSKKKLQRCWLFGSHFTFLPLLFFGVVLGLFRSLVFVLVRCFSSSS
ncbi:unnamed protein product, partial [Musa acuminata subsp. burmannicoides]